MKIRNPLLMLALSAALAACEDGPTGSRNTLAVTAEGSGQQGLPGALLPTPLLVRVTRPDGSPAREVSVRFETSAGSLESTYPKTDADGVARAWWRLPAQAGGQPSATARVEGAAEEVRFTAGWLPPERADLVLANAGTHVRMLLHPAGLPFPDLSFRAAFADSLRLVPFASAPGQGLIAFADGRTPIIREPVAWTGGRDTLRLEFAGPVSVPITFWIIRRPFETVAETMEQQMGRARSIWARAGIHFPDVRVIDATGFPNADLYQDQVEPCGNQYRDIGFEAGRTNVYVVGGVNRGGVRYGGWTCSNDYIAMSAPVRHTPELLAHELGHTFGLSHIEGANVMNPSAVESAITSGQIYWAHIDTVSAIPRRYAGDVRYPTRNCREPNSPCLHVLFEF